jgi:opacity protein-like surface antigen
MRKLVLATFAAVALAAPAYAADMPAKVAPAAPAATPWSGFYFGAIGAGAKTAGDFALLDIPGNGNVRPSGFMAGGMIGVGGWTGNLFIGLEADASYDFSKADQPCGFVASTVIGCELKSGWFLTQRAVIGAQMNSITGAARRVAPAKVTQWRDSLSVPNTFAASSIMPYVTAGIAERRVSACITDQGCARQWIMGPAFGGGVRVPVSAGFSLGVEYLYVKYDKSFTPAGGPAIFEADFKAVSEHLGRISLTGHF